MIKDVVDTILSLVKAPSADATGPWRPERLKPANRPLSKRPSRTRLTTG